MFRFRFIHCNCNDWDWEISIPDMRRLRSWIMMISWYHERARARAEGARARACRVKLLKNNEKTTKSRKLRNHENANYIISVSIAKTGCYVCWLLMWIFISISFFLNWKIYDIQYRHIPMVYQLSQNSKNKN